MPTDPSPSGRRFSAEELEHWAALAADMSTRDLCRQALSDATALAGIRTWLIENGAQDDPQRDIVRHCYHRALAELDRLEGR